MTVTHPFHPWHGRSYEFVVRRKNWGEDRVYFRGEAGEVLSAPTAWTDAGGEDPFVVLAAARSPFRTEDLLALADLINRLGGQGDGVREMTP
ncbi:DUF5372 family protein [Streptomyces mirabilis]